MSLDWSPASSSNLLGNCLKQNSAAALFGNTVGGDGGESTGLSLFAGGTVGVFAAVLPLPSVALKRHVKHSRVTRRVPECFSEATFRAVGRL